MKRFLAIAFLLISISCSAITNKVQVDSLKTLLATSLKNAATPDTISIKRLNRLAADYFESYPDSTLYYGKESIELSRKINYKSGIANALLETGHANYFMGKFAQAQTELDEAISIFNSLNDKKGLADCYSVYGRLHNLLANYKLALNYLNSSLDIYKQLKNDEDIALCYKNIGIVYFSQGKLSTALDYYYKALFVDVKLHNKPATAAIYNDIGVVLQGIEVYPKALGYYKKALDTYESSHNLQGIGIVNENIGEVLLAQKNYDAAITYLTKAINIAQKQDDKEGMSAVYTDLGLCYANRNQFSVALKYLDRSLKISNKYKIVYNEAYTLIGYTTVYNLEGDFENAYKYAIKGQQLAEKLGNLSVRANAALQLNKTLAGLGKFEDAYQSLKQYIDLKDSLNDNESIQKLTSYNLEFNFANKEHKQAKQQLQKDESYQQRIKQQRLINAIFLFIILGMITTSTVYYRQKRAQQKVNAMLEDKNKEVLQQKADLDDQATKLNDLNNLKDRLMSILAHDLRAPLSTLRGLFSLLQDESISHDQMLEMIPNVLKKLEYTSDFLDTLLFWINSQMDNFDSASKSFYIKDILTYETENYSEQASLKGIQLVDNVPNDILASADPNSVRIVVRNLITNAIKFSNTNDTIEVKAAQYDDHHLVITVTDSGTGMTGEQLSKIFKSKVNSKVGTQNESGTGMGLLFCKDLVEKCNGKIWVTSTLGKGTQFSFTVPTGILEEMDTAMV